MPTPFPRPRCQQACAGVLGVNESAQQDVEPAWRDALLPEMRLPRPCSLFVEHDRSLPTQGYRLAIDPEAVRIVASDLDGARYGLRCLRQLLLVDPTPCVRIEDHPALEHRGVQIDLGRVVERPETVLRLLDAYASLHINRLQLYLENALIFPSHPTLARQWAWSLEQAQGVVQAAAERGISVIPAIQSLGHCQWVTSSPGYRELDEGAECGSLTGVLCPSHGRTHQMLRDMIWDVAPLATAGIIHLGMDESFSLGVCSRCAPLKQQIGEGGIFVQHANRVAAYAREVGKRPAIWGDMFGFYPDTVSQLDRDVLILDWYYYAFERFPRIELFGFEEIDSLAMWQRRGLEAWGCPWSVCSTIMPINEPRQSIANATSWLAYLRQRGGRGMMCTQWELKPTSIDLCPPIEAAQAAAMWEGDGCDPQDLLARGCGHLYGRPGVADWLAEIGRHRFHGHGARRWLGAASVEAMITCAGSERDQADVTLAEGLERMADQAAAWVEPGATASLAPLPLAARWLAYQYRKRSTVNGAVRHCVDRRFAIAAAQLHPLIEQARQLAHAWQCEWDRNRYPQDPSVLPHQLRREAALIEAEVATLQAAAGGEAYRGGLHHPILVLTLVNSHPGLPNILVQASSDGENFNDVGSCYILQFDNAAARPRSDEQLEYPFVLPSLQQARHVRIIARGGAFSLRAVRIQRGEETRGPIVAVAAGRIADPQPWMAGQADALLMGHDQPRTLFEKLQAHGAGGRIFQLEHGSVTLEFDNTTWTTH